MIYKVITATSPPNWIWFSAHLKADAVYVQDHIHIGTKLKSCLLKASVILPMGKEHLVSRGHLVELINTVSKDQHELRESHINPKDKMNYRAVQLMSAEKVTLLLRTHISKSEGTATFLDMMREVVESFTRPDLKPLTRVQMIWKWVFFLRMWRSWIEEHKQDYSVRNNFISSNSYACIEVNAHSLIQILIKCRDAEEHNLFLPWLMSSQACEGKFRRLRTVTENFSIFDLENNFRRIELLTKTYVNLSQVIHLPRHHKAAKISEANAHISTCLPEDYEIEHAVMAGLQEAVTMATKFKLVSKPRANFIPVTHLKMVEMASVDQELELEDEVEIDSGEVDVDNDLDEEVGDFLAATLQEEDRRDDTCDLTEDLYIVSSGLLGVRKFNNVPLTESSPFVLVGDGFGNPQIIRKSTFIWMKSSGDTTLSSDRLLRVQESEVNHLNSMPKNLLKPSKEETIYVGEWCAFAEEGKIVVGRVLAFSYMQGRSIKDQEYKRLSAPVKAPQKNARGLGCLCSWFSFKGNSRVLTHTSMDSHGYFEVEHYLCSLPRPVMRKNQLLLSCSPKSISQFME